MKSNFEYLKKNYAGIYSELLEAENFFYIEDIFLLKIRKALEIIFFKISEEQDNGRFIKSLKKIDGVIYHCMKNYLNIKEQEEYHSLRKRCNESVHGKLLQKSSIENRKKDLYSLVKLTLKLENVTQIPEKIESKCLELKYKKESIQNIFKLYKNTEMPEQIEKSFYDLEEKGITKDEINILIKKLKIEYNVKFFSDSSYSKNKMIDNYINKNETTNILIEKAQS
ncbi:MAG: hypothetical protein ACRC4S_02570, partial [Cetobacterium sp.]